MSVFHPVFHADFNKVLENGAGYKISEVPLILKVNSAHFSFSRSDHVWTVLTCRLALKCLLCQMFSVFRCRELITSSLMFHLKVL